MKGFEKNGKWLGLALVAVCLLFAGCGGSPSSEEGTVSSNSQTSSTGVPMEMNNGQLIIGNGSGSGTGVINGHTVEIKNGPAGCANNGDNGADCEVTLINRAKEAAMVNVEVFANGCVGCASPRFDNADVTGMVVGMTLTAEARICGSTRDGNPDGACQGAINGGGFTYVEDGKYIGALPPYNVYGAAPVATAIGDKPRQILHPDCGQKNTVWSFGNQTSPNYKFWANIAAQYVPWAPKQDDGTILDSRYNWADRTTMYFMIVGLNDLLTDAGASHADWYRLGSYQRSTVLSGYGSGGGKANLAAGQYFALDLAVEYADRIEGQVMGNTTSFHPGPYAYEYYSQIATVFRYDPSAVELLPEGAATDGGTWLPAGNPATGSPMDYCDLDTDSTYCSKGKQTWINRLVDLSSSYMGTGWIGLNTSPSEDFKWMAGGNKYSTVYGAIGTVKAGTSGRTLFPWGQGQQGVARINLTKGVSKTLNSVATGLIQEGVDTKPELPMVMYYFHARRDAAGRGSEFFLDAVPGYTSYTYGYTKGSLLPSGPNSGTLPACDKPAGSGTSCDWLTYCWPMNGALTDAVMGCGADNAARIIAASEGERPNENISQSGPVTRYSMTVDNGAWQQWPAHVCIQ